MNFKDCLSKGLIRKDKSAIGRVKKSLEIAERFLVSARKNIEIEELEMAEIASYNSIFHSARSLLFKKGYTERSHICVILALKEFKSQKCDLVEAYRFHARYRGIMSGKGKYCEGFARHV